ncbi:MAG: hypothetical protein QOF36_2597 [Microbacteriaceae bacterium]|jgi:hypothetical protein|nr:hypothetical protein [Microbacteriaceae bacterium]
MTANRSFKQRVRARMEETGEKYTEARRALLEADGRQPDSVTPVKRSEPQQSDESLVRGFFEELDRRIAGTSGSLSRERRERLANLKPVLVKRHKDDPEGFARRLRDSLPSLR